MYAREAINNQLKSGADSIIVPTTQIGFGI